MDILGKAQASVHESQARKAYEAEDYRKALTNYLQLLKFKLSSKSSSGLPDLYRSIGLCYMKLEVSLDDEKRRNTLKAAGYFIKSGDAFGEAGDPHNAGISYEFAGNCYEEVGDNAKAAEIDKKSAEMFGQSHEDYQSSHAYLEAAGYAEKNGDFAGAGEDYIKAAELEVNLKDSTKASSNYKHAGACFERLGKHERAREVYLLAGGLDEKLGDYVSAAKAFEAVALSEENLGDFKGALENHLKSADISEKNAKAGQAVTSYGNAGRCAMKLGDADGALKFMDQARKIASDSKDNKSEAKLLAAMGGAYQARGKVDDAINSFKASADASFRLGDRGTAVESLRKAIKLDEGRVSELSGGGKSAEAAGYLVDEAECFEKLKDFEQAADKFFKAAELLSKLEDPKKSSEVFMRAAEDYAHAKRPGKAADCYIKVGQFEKAGEYFSQKAAESLGLRDYFAAGESYETASYCFEKLARVNEVKDYCNKTIWQFTTFLDEAKNKGNADAAKVASAKRKITECYLRLDLARKSLPYAQLALDDYMKLNDERSRKIAEAEKHFLEAKIAFTQAQYEVSINGFKEAVRLVGEVGRKGFSEFYGGFLDGLAAKSQEVLKEIETKPDVLIVVGEPEGIEVDARAVMQVLLTNMGGTPVFDIAFMPYTPEGFRVIEKPAEISELAAGASSRLKVVVEPSEAGEFKFRPLEVLYHDKEGRKYMKSSNELKVKVPSEAGGLEVVSASKMDDALLSRIGAVFDEHLGGASGRKILLVGMQAEQKPQVTTGMLNYLLASKKLSGAYVTASIGGQQVTSITKEFSEAGRIRVIDVAAKMATDNPPQVEDVKVLPHPAALEILSHEIKDALENLPESQKFLILDDLPSLIKYNDEDSIKEFTLRLITSSWLEAVTLLIEYVRDDTPSQLVEGLEAKCDSHIKLYKTN